MEHKIGDGNAVQVRALLDSAGLTPSTLTHAPLFAVGQPDLRERRVNELLHVLDVAVEVGAPTVYGTPGPAIGVPWAQSRDDVLAVAERVSSRSSAAGIPVLVEMTLPLYAEFSFLHSLRDSLDLIDATGLGINLDIFAVWGERDLAAAIHEGAEHIKLCQISDYRLGTRSLPARLVPGDGDLPLRQLLASILDAGYEGLFELELQGPEIDREGTAKAVERAGHVLSDLLAGLGA